MKIGITFGGYSPLHRGHLDCIMQAKKENDVCFVVVCGYDHEPRTEELGLDLNLKYDIIRHFFKDDETIRVIKIDDTELGIDESMSEENWDIWLDAVMEQIMDNGYTILRNRCTFYVAEQSYKEAIEKRMQWHYLCDNCVLVPKTINVSGTKIRKNPIKYWDYIARPFRPYLTHNILITGTASEGKSTLVKDISIYFNLPHTTEYGRTYMAQRNITDKDLTLNDFGQFISGQFRYISNARRNPTNRGITIHDTDNIVTLMYAKRYSEDPAMPNINPEDYPRLKTTADKFSKLTPWHKIFVIKPHAEFIDDGTRYMEHASIEERMKNYDILMQLIEEAGYMDKVTVLENGSYLDNFNTVKEYINSISGNEQ